MKLEELKNRIKPIQSPCRFEDRGEGLCRGRGSPPESVSGFRRCVFRHPYEVAMILAEFEYDPVTIAAGLLHDVLEDTDVTRGGDRGGVR